MYLENLYFLSYYRYNEVNTFLVKKTVDDVTEVSVSKNKYIGNS